MQTAETPWPQQQNGMMVCSKEKPMPDRRGHTGERWLHWGAAPTGELTKDSVQYKCRYCGHIWNNPRQR